MAKKVFILGVGAQKCGTTWLHSQFSKNANIDMGFTKEYHVFDAMEPSRGKKMEDGSLRNGLREKMFQSLVKLHGQGRLGINEGPSRAKRKFAALKLSFIDNIDTYFDYFDYLYLKSEIVEAVGDITPNYALLRPETFSLIRDGVKKRGFDIRVFFLMRDPVERIWSSVRMKKRALWAQKQEKLNEIQFFQNLLKNDNSSIKHSKSEYSITCKNLEKVFEPSEIYFGFFESLFGGESRDSISNFMGICLQDFQCDQIVNASPEDIDLPADLIKRMAIRHSETYNFALDKFGDKMKKLWQGYNLL